MENTWNREESSQLWLACQNPRMQQQLIQDVTKDHRRTSKELPQLISELKFHNKNATEKKMGFLGEYQRGNHCYPR
uniref:Uncharacterized protein n=1 Tax=Anguilla anguilla TaxID=7936 RepID=A0A0E9PIK6_ANGAN